MSACFDAHIVLLPQWSAVQYSVFVIISKKGEEYERI